MSRFTEQRKTVKIHYAFISHIINMSSGLRLGTLCVIDHKLSYLTSLQKIQQYRFQRRLENLTYTGDLLTNLLELSKVMKA